MGSGAPQPRRYGIGVLTGFGFGLAILAGAVVGLASYQSLLRLERDTDARYATHVTLMSLARLLTHLIDAETGQRGYLLTGDTIYLEPYHAAVQSLTGDTLALRRNATSDSSLASVLASLAPMIATRLAQLDTTIKLRRSGQIDRMRSLVETGRGRRLMDSIRVVLATASRAAEVRRDGRTARVRRASTNTKRVIFVSGALTVTLLVGAGFAISRQLAARANAEAELRNREHELFQMLEAMPVGVFVLDGTGRTYYTNRRSQDLLGRGTTGATTRDLAETYHAYRAGTNDLYPSETLPVVRALHGETVQVADVEIHRPDGVVPLEVWAAPVRDEAGTISYAIAAFGDMTERERQRRELEALNKELETFSYSVSHDLRSPLRAIDGFSRMLLEDYGSTLDAEGRRLLDVVRSSTQRMGRLIDDLLAFSKFSRREMRVGPVDMAALARGAIEDLRQAGGDGRSTVTIGDLPAARGDASLLRQVWANLLGNAVKYSRVASEPQVDVSAEQRGPMVEYRVRDNGVGFDMAYAGKLFGVFQRLHKAEEFEGTGVGLATVQRIVHRHGGRVWAESQVGQGATFYFTLPAGA